MSIDVEDWFQVENLQRGIPRATWDDRELRVEKNIDLVLELLAARAHRATFFILGWIAERAPGMVRRIAAEGHEIASHGYGHELVYRMTRERFLEDIRRSRGVLEDLAGHPIEGYRAPNFSITDWAVDVLHAEGFRYDSSLFPVVAHDRYGKIETATGSEGPVFELRPGFAQVMLSCLTIGRYGIPWAGGGYFRLIPYPVFRRGIKTILRRESVYCFYLHPWELDPAQPSVTGIDLLYRFRHYHNLEKTRSRFERLLGDFSFIPLRDVVAAHVPRSRT